MYTYNIFKFLLVHVRIQYSEDFNIHHWIILWKLIVLILAITEHQVPLSLTTFYFI
jgi:hypothetical protein